MVKKITQYMSRDKRFHNSMDEALAYEGLLDVYDYVDKHPIYCGSTESSVDGQAFGLWLKDNPSIFVKYLHGGECPQGQEDEDGS